MSRFFDEYLKNLSACNIVGINVYFLLTGVGIIETVMNKQGSNYKGRWIAIIALLVFLSNIFILTHFFSIYPGGYSIEKQSSEVLIRKGADVKGVVLTNNELKIASLESQIAHIKTLWYVGLLFTATCLIGAITFNKLILKRAVFILALLYVIMAILVIVSYAGTISSIENSISNLIN